MFTKIYISVTFVIVYFYYCYHKHYLMKIVNFSEHNSLLNTFVREIRDINIQNDRLRFRKNIERIGEIMAYELSKDLNYTNKTIETPLGETSINVADNDIVIATILRAGLIYHQGFLNFFDGAENAFVSAYRKYKENQQSFNIHIEYIASPQITDKTLIITDPMLATGGSMELSYHALLTKGKPKHIHIATIIASQQAIDYCKEKFPNENTTIWAAAIDPDLDKHAYIVPGLGDAGDLAYGEKE